jgi:hypothetical protein
MSVKIDRKSGVEEAARCLAPDAGTAVLRVLRGGRHGRGRRCGCGARIDGGAGTKSIVDQSLLAWDGLCAVAAKFSCRNLLDFCLILQTGDNQAIFSRSAMPSRIPFVYAFGGLQRQVFRPGGSRAYLILLIFCLFLQVFWRRIGQADELR